MNKWMVEKEQLDDIQTTIIGQSLNKSMLVSGCAGSGKTILALYRAVKIEEQNKILIQNGEEPKTFFIVVYTHVLRQFIEDGIRALDLNDACIDNYHSWRSSPDKYVNYLIVDEAQDFKEIQIREMLESKEDSVMFLGDRAQNLYFNNANNETPFNMNGIVALDDDINTENLNFNYRLPKKIARVARYLQNQDEEETYVQRCVREGEQLPRFFKLSGFEAQMNYIKNDIESKNLTDVGILVPTNKNVETVLEWFKNNNIDCEARYKMNERDDRGFRRTFDTLDFASTNPKITTYHSAKGCQFDSVFLPLCENYELFEQREDNFWAKPLYVGFTRAVNNVHVLYSNKLPKFFNFDMIPNNLYISENTSVDTTF